MGSSASSGTSWQTFHPNNICCDIPPGKADVTGSGTSSGTSRHLEVPPEMPQLGAAATNWACCLSTTLPQIRPQPGVHTAPVHPPVQRQAVTTRSIRRWTPEAEEALRDCYNTGQGGAAGCTRWGHWGDDSLSIYLSIYTHLRICIFIENKCTGLGGGLAKQRKSDRTPSLPASRRGFIY